MKRVYRNRRQVQPSLEPGDQIVTPWKEETTMDRWSRDYQTIRGADLNGDQLVVKFANGDVRELKCSAVVPPDARDIQWSSVYVSEDCPRHVTLVPDRKSLWFEKDSERVHSAEVLSRRLDKRSQDVLGFPPRRVSRVPWQKPPDFGLDVPWDVIRRVTDDDFAKEMAQLAAEQAQHIGKRLRVLRRARGLTQAQVAARASIEAANLSRIENGHFDLATSTLWKLLAAMGCSAGDLSEE